MDMPVELPPIAVPDEQVRAAARARQSTLAKPVGALGRLEDVSVWAAGVQGQCPPRPFSRVRVLVVAGDHGAASRGVSVYPPEATGRLLATIRTGEAAVNVLAAQSGATVRVVDAAVLGTGSAEQVRAGSGSIDVEDALTEPELRAGLALGLRVADEEIDAGADLLVVGDLGIGNTTAAAALVAALTGAEPVAVVGRGTGIDDAGWSVKTATVRDALARLRRAAVEAGGGPPGALLALRTVGGADLAALCGLLAQAAARRTPVLLDGLAVCAAALAAEQLAPGAQRWWLAATRSPEPAQALALDAIGVAAPLLDLGLRLGEGTGGLLAVPLVQAAVATLTEMATAQAAGVSRRTA